MTLLSLLPLSVASLLAPGAHDLVYAPEAGTELTRELVWTVGSKTVSTTTTLGGGETDEVPDISFDSTRTVEVTVVDSIEVASDGRATKLVRRYDDLIVEFSAAIELGFAGQRAELEMGGDGTSALEGQEVRFDWDDDAEAYERAFVDEDGAPDPNLLDGLEADLDLRALLPGESVEVGAEWDIDLANIAGVLVPGGDVSLVLETDLDRIEGAMDPADLPGVVDLLRKGRIEGEATCELESVEDGLATVIVKLDLQSRASFVDEMGGVAREAAPEGVSVDLSLADFALELEGSGRLVWDLAGGHARSFEFEAEVTEESETAADVGSDGQVMDFEQLQTRSGVFAFTCSVSRD